MNRASMPKTTSSKPSKGFKFKKVKPKKLNLSRMKNIKENLKKESPTLARIKKNFKLKKNTTSGKSYKV